MPAAPAQIPDPSADAGRPLAPFVIRLREDMEMSPLPPWMQAQASVHEELEAVEIPLPSLFAQPAAECFIVTVVFNDGGDGGPAVEWRGKDGETRVVSEGLGEALDDRPLGLNARTILLPQEFTRDGGALLVSYFGGFSSLTSISVQPATQSVVAVAGGSSDPAVIDKRLKALTGAETDGLRRPPLSGDVRDGAVVEAELAAAIEKLEEEIEFIIPVEGRIEGGMFLTEVLGLDPEATIGIFLNDSAAGILAMERFALGDPATTENAAGRLVVAGWREGSLFLPARMWKTGENRLLLKLKRVSPEEAGPVFLRGAGLHLRFGKASTPAGRTANDSPAPEIDLLQKSPFVEPPGQPGMPVVITTKP